MFNFDNRESFERIAEWVHFLKKDCEYNGKLNIIGTSFDENIIDGYTSNDEIKEFINKVQNLYKIEVEYNKLCTKDQQGITDMFRNIKKHILEERKKISTTSEGDSKCLIF